MVNAAVTSGPRADAREAEQALAIGYAPVDRRSALTALLALDRRLGDILRTTREPIVGQMRLTWWHEALSTLDGRSPPIEPVLEAVADNVLPYDLKGTMLAAMIDGWEVLLEDPTPDDRGLATYADRRGGVLFGAAAKLLGSADPRVAMLGEGWALADLAANLGDPSSATRAAAMARTRLKALGGGSWSRPGRPLAALALLARSDLEGGMPGSPARVARLLALRLTGR